MEASRMKPRRSACAALGFFLFFAAIAAAADSDWHIVRVEGRDYLPMDDVAKFYGFPGPVPPSSQILPVNPLEPNTKKLKPGSGRQQLEVTRTRPSARIDRV